jgi:hypothetical protein
MNKMNETIIEQNMVVENKINETKIEENVNFTELLKNSPKSNIILFKSDNVIDINNIDWKDLKKIVSNKILENGGLAIPKDINTNKKLLEYIKENFKYNWEIMIMKNDILYKFTNLYTDISEPEYVNCDIEQFKEQLIENEYELISCHINKVDIVDKLPKKKSCYNIKDIYKYIFKKSTKDISSNVFDLIHKKWSENTEYELCLYNIVIKNLQNNVYYKYEFKYQLDDEFDYNLDQYVTCSLNLSNCYQSDEEQEKPIYRKFEIDDI